MPSSPAAERTLLHPVALLLLVLVVAGALGVLLLRPPPPLEVGAPDTVELAYLRAALAHRPQDADRRLALARALGHTGALDEALEVLSPLLALPDGPDERARELAWELRLPRWRQLAAGDPRRLVMRQELVEALRRRLPALPAAQRSVWVPVALELGGVSLASELFGPELVSRATSPVEPLAAADRLLSEALRAPTSAQAERQVLQAVELLRGVQDTAVVLAQLERAVALLGDSAAVLDRAVAVALERSALTPARRWQQRRVALAPRDVEVLRKQMELALAAGEPGAALAPARQLARLLGSVSAHRQAAEVAGWSGALEASLEEWLWLARREGTAEQVSRAMALSRMLWDLRAQVELLLLRARRGGLSAQERTELVGLREALGQPEAAERYLTLYLRQHPEDTAALELLAGVRTRVSDLDGALAAWEAHQRREGPSVATALRQAELHWRRERPREALAALRAVRHLAAPEDDTYWLMLGQVALALDDEAVGLDAWRAVHARDPRHVDAARQVAGLLGRSRRHAEALAFVREALRAEFDSIVLFHGLEAGVVAERWEEALALVRESEPHMSRFKDDAQLALLVARVLRGAGQREQALEWVQRVLTVTPHASHARLALLSLLLERHDTPAVLARLAEWAEDAAVAPEYWEAYAYAYVELDQPASAAPWFARVAAARPGDPFLRMDQAEVLTRAGDTEGARGVWREVRALLEPRVQQLAASPSAPSPGDLRALLVYLDVLSRLEGDDATLAWVPLVEERLRDNVEAQRWLLGLHLRRNDVRAARELAARLERAGHRLEPWQQLALAAREEDSRALERLLKDHGAALSLEDQVYARRLLGQDGTAYALVTRPMGSGGGSGGSEGLRQLRRELRERVAPRLEVRGSLLKQGDFGARALTARARTGQLLDSLFELEAGVFEHRLERGPVGAPGKARDVGAGLRATFGPPRRRTELAVGVEARGAALLPRASAARQRGFGTRGMGRAELALNARPDDGPLRLSALRHHLTLSGDVLLGKHADASLSLTGMQYRTRGSALLGHGAQGSAALGRTLTLGGFALRGYLAQELVLHRLSAPVTGWERAHAAPLLPPFAASSGAGLTLVRGDVREAAGGAPVRLLADAWGGWLWPAQRPGYRLTLGVGLSLLGDTQLGLETTLANTLAGGVAAASFSFGLGLHQRFGP